MTITSNCQSINQKLNQLRNLLVTKLHNCYIEKETTDSFTELIEAVGDIRAVEVSNKNNIRPTNMPEIDDTNLSTFHITLYARIRYYMKLLGYFLVLKGVPRYEVNAQTDLKGLIELIDMIDVIKPSFLTLGHIDEIQYFGTNIEVPYILKDIDGLDIQEGDITIKDSAGTVYDSIEVGGAIVITPLDISPKINDEYQYETFTVIYNGTDKYTKSTPQTFRVKILPAQLRLILTITNMSTDSRYYNSTTTGYENDEWTISIKTLNHQNQPLAEIPFNLSIDNELILEDEETDNNGYYVLNHQIIDEAGNHTIRCTTIYADTDRISNASIDYTVQIKYNILKQTIKNYTDYTGKNSYRYEVELIDEETGQRTNQYDGQIIKIFLYEEYSDNTHNGEQIGTTTITNGKAIYTFNSLSVGDKILTWLFEYNNFSVRATTNLHILSNFIFPEKQSYFLNTTPTIIYAPEGVKSANNTVTGTLEYTTYDEVIVGYNTEQILIGYETETTEPVFEGYEQTYNEQTGQWENILDEHGDPIPIYSIPEEIEVLDENGNPIPIYETQSTPITELREISDTENITLTTNANGELDTISNYKNIGFYNLILHSSNELNETCIWTYELKKPFDIETINYNKKELIQYKITLYDSEDITNYNINSNMSSYITDNSGTASLPEYNINLSKVTTYTDENNNTQSYTYPTYILTINKTNNLVKNNTIVFTCNEYQESFTFKFINQVFTLLTNSVTLGHDTMEIRCNDDNVTSIDIYSPHIEVNNITYENNIFIIDATFTNGGNISFNAIDDSLSEETLSIQVNKINLEPYLEALVYAPYAEDPNTDDNQIAYVDVDKIAVSFNINTELYSNLSITYKITQGNNQLHTQSFTYNMDESENNFTLTVPNLTSGQYQLEFIFTGDNNYYAFDKITNFEIFKATPTHEIINQYTSFKGHRFFIYQPEFSEENPETLISNNNILLTTTQAGGTWTSVGYYLADGWVNTGLWECDFDMKLNRLHYINIQLLCALEPTFKALFRGWEGPLATTPIDSHVVRDNDDNLTLAPYGTVTATDSRYYNYSTPWVHINIKKSSPTTLTITKTGDVAHNGSVTYEWQELSNYPRVTIGSKGNDDGDRRIIGKMSIKNFIVRGVY